MKTRVSKSRKIEIFPHGFSPKMAIFPTFFFRQYRAGKCLLRDSRRKKRLSRLLKEEFQKVEKLRFFQRGYSIVLGKNWLSLQP